MIQLHRYSQLYPGTLIRRHKRFLVDVRLDDGREITAFNPNSGSMKTCSEPGSPVMLSHDPKPVRKTEYTLEMVRTGSTWVGVNTVLANTLGAKIIDMGLTGFAALDRLKVTRKEVVFEDSRLDILAHDGPRNCHIEIKNVTYRKNGAALFPDAVTTRGRKHLETLLRICRAGSMACNLFIIQRSDCRSFAPACDIDPDYTESLHRAVKTGVFVVPCMLHVEPEGVFFIRTLPLAEPWE